MRAGRARNVPQSVEVLAKRDLQGKQDLDSDVDLTLWLSPAKGMPEPANNNYLQADHSNKEFSQIKLTTRRVCAINEKIVTTELHVSFNRPAYWSNSSLPSLFGRKKRWNHKDGFALCRRCFLVNSSLYRKPSVFIASLSHRFNHSNHPQIRTI